MNYIQKNRKTILIIAIAMVVLAGFLIWLFQNKEYGLDDVAASVYPISLNVGETVNYADKSPFGTSIKWHFGDGTESTEKKGTHIYKEPGYYQISMTLDNKFTKTFNILVNLPLEAQLNKNLPTFIDGPIQARQLETVSFRAVAENAKTYTWKFGESGLVDANGETASYAYKRPGNYTVTLYTNSDPYPITHQIRITPSYPDESDPGMAPIVTQGEIQNKINDDFRFHLQKIAYGINFNYHYNYLKRTYLCNEDNVTLSANGKDTSFYYYCTSLQFDKNNLIQEVKTTIDVGQNCVTKIEVKHTKQ